MPDRLSEALSVTCTAPPYQPAPFGSATVAVVVGAERSILMPATVLVTVLPATSSQAAVAERFSPSPLTTVSAGWPAGPDSSSVQVQATVTSPVCQPLEKLPVK